MHRTAPRRRYTAAAEQMTDAFVHLTYVQSVNKAAHREAKQRCAAAAAHAKLT